MLLFSFAGLAAVLVLAYLRVLFFGETFAVRDHLTWTLPSRAFLAESLRHGHWPEWWDALRLGERFAADPNNGVTYPMAWLVALVDPLVGADLLLLLHLLLAGTGTVLFARRLGASRLGAFFGASTLMTSGYLTSMIVNGSILMALGWMPLLAWAALGIAQVEERKDYVGRALVFAGVLAGSVASGNPAQVNNSVLAGAIVLFCASRRGLAFGVLSAAGVLGLAMGAASLLPPLLTLADSARAAGLSLEQSGAWSMHPLRLIELVWPQFLGLGLRPEVSLAGLWAHGGGKLEPIWSGSNYVGLPVLLCAGLAALKDKGEVRRLAILSLAFVVLALGTFTPVYRFYRTVFWFEHVLRYPEKHLATAIVLWAALAAVGFDRWFECARADRRVRRIPVVFGLVVLAAVGIGYLSRVGLCGAIVQESRARGVGIDAPAAVRAVLEGGVWAALAALGMWIATRFSAHPRFGTLMRPGLAVLVIGHLVAHDWSVHVLIPRDIVRDKPVMLAPLKPSPAGVPTRILRRVQETMPITVSDEMRTMYLYELAADNTATRFGFGQVPGYSIAGTARFDALAEASGRASLERVMDLLDIRYLIIRAAEADAMGMPLVTPGVLAGHVMLENQERRPRAFVAYRWQHVASDQQILASLFVPNRADVDLGAVRLSGQGDSQTSGTDNPSPCQIERPTPEHVLLHCRAERPGYAVLLDEWTHGWAATVDGRAVEIERADTVFRALAIPQGPHVVEMRYRTPGLRAGAVVSLGGWLVFAAMVAVFLVRRRRG